MSKQIFGIFIVVVVELIVSVVSIALIQVLYPDSLYTERTIIISQEAVWAPRINVLANRPFFFFKGFL